ncbi:MAG: Ig domain-containing protein, partial [Clostridia bacterium]|nr:Ig domain-containing protein [Clostridia bacterium]
MKKSKNVKSRILAVLLAAAMTGSVAGGSLTAFAADPETTTAASTINDNEQKILDEASKSLTINNQEKKIDPSIITQAKAYFETVDVTDEQATAVLEKLADFKSYVEKTGLYRFSEYSKTQINEFLTKSTAVVAPLGLKVTYDFTEAKLSVVDESGSVIGGVNGVAVTGITVNKTSLTLNKGKSATLEVVVEPNDATNQDVVWTSANKNIATVSEAGVVKAVKVGTTTITAATADGKYTATVKVTVNSPATKITLNKTSATIGKGKTATVTAKIEPTDCTDKTITWKTSDSKIATVKNGVITAKAVGTATITATTASGKTATCKVTVKNLPTSIKLNKTSATIGKGKTLTLKA